MFFFFFHSMLSLLSLWLLYDRKTYNIPEVEMLSVEGTY